MTWNPPNGAIITYQQVALNPTAVQESKKVSLPVWTKTAEPAKPAAEKQAT